jgi:single stranded DNA-binding protein
MNKSIISGIVGSDPEIKPMANGSKVARLDIRVSKEFIDGSGESAEKILWFRVEAWNKLADFVEATIFKNDRVLIEGEWDIEKWNDQDGNPKIKFLINPKSIEKLN